MYDDFNNSNQRGRVEENRDLSPLDEFGNEQVPNNQNNNNNQGNKFGGFLNRNNNNNNNNGGDNRGWTGVIIAIVIIFVLGLLMFKGGDFLTSAKRFIGTPTENLNTMQNSIVELETVNKKEGDFDEVQDKNALFDESVLFYMPEKEYLVYVYTGKEDLDKTFDKFVKKYQKDIPIYKINYMEIDSNIEVKTIIESEFKPYLISMVDLGKSVKVVDTVIDSNTQLKNVPDYFKDLVEEDNFTKTEVHQYDSK